MASTPALHRVAAGPDDSGQRLDKLLARHFAALDADAVLSRARLQAMIRDGSVYREAGAVIHDGGLKVKAGDAFIVTVQPPAPPEPAGEAIPLQVVHEDADIIVIDKPAGLVVHPAAGHGSGTLVNALIAHCGDSLSGIGGVRRPGIVHRLDKDTSGLLVVAKTDRAHQRLAEQFALHGADGKLERRYQALVWGAPERASGRIDAALARSQSNRTKIAVVRGLSGRHAVTHYEVLDSFAAGGGDPDPKRGPVASLVSVVLETGRTHQIRVHMAHVGHPVLGDPVYGAGFSASKHRLGPLAACALADLGRQALHAAVLGFRHPRTSRQMRFESPLPAELARLVAALRAQR